MIDQTISHYKILAKLDEGGMSSLMKNRKKLIPRAGGVVYKGEDTRLNRNGIRI